MQRFGCWSHSRLWETKKQRSVKNRGQLRNRTIDCVARWSQPLFTLPRGTNNKIITMATIVQHQHDPSAFDLLVCCPSPLARSQVRILQSQQQPAFLVHRYVLNFSIRLCIHWPFCSFIHSFICWVNSFWMLGRWSRRTALFLSSFCLHLLPCLLSCVAHAVGWIAEPVWLIWKGFYKIYYVNRNGIREKECVRGLGHSLV